MARTQAKKGIWGVIDMFTENKVLVLKKTDQVLCSLRPTEASWFGEHLGQGECSDSG